MTPCQKLLKQEGTARRIESMQQSSATPSLHLWFLGVAEDCCMLSILLVVPSCFNSFWHGVIPTSYFIFNDFYTCIYTTGNRQRDRTDCLTPLRACAPQGNNHYRTLYSIAPSRIYKGCHTGTVVGYTEFCLPSVRMCIQWDLLYIVIVIHVHVHPIECIM